MGGKSTSSSGTTWSIGNEQQEPWWAQSGYLQDAFKRAEGAYKENMATGPYKGDYVALGDDKNTAAYEQAFNFGTDKQNLGYVDNQFNSANNWLNNGSGWMNRGASELEKLSGDQTGYILENAKKFGDNDYIGNAVKASMFDAYRSASENEIPNLYRSAAGANALNSDRAALAQGLVERGLAEQAQSLSAKMRYDAWNKGIDTTTSELGQRRAGWGSIADLGTRASGLGMEGLAQGIANQSRLNQMSAAGAEGLRSLRQDALNNEMAKYEGKQNFPWQALNNFYNIIGNRSWGGSRSWSQIGGENKTTKEDSGVMSKIGGGLGFLDAIFSGGSGGGILSGIGNFL